MTEQSVDGERLGEPQGNSGRPSNLPSPPHGVRELVERLASHARDDRKTADIQATWIERDPRSVQYVKAYQRRADDLDQAADALTAQDQRLAELTRERDYHSETSRLNTMLAHKWMVAHDALKSGLPYDYPKPADLPEAVARLAELTKERDYWCDLAEEYDRRALRLEIERDAAEARSTRAEGLLGEALRYLKYCGAFAMRLKGRPARELSDEVAALLSSISGGEVFSSSSSSLPAHVADATATDAQHSAGWRTMLERPQPRSKIALLYEDGSGATLYYVTDYGTLLDGEDGCEYTWEDRDIYNRWAYLPWSHALWVEHSSEPFTLPPPPAESGDSSPAAGRAATAGLDEQTISGGEGEGFRQTPEQPQCGVGPSDLTGQGGEP